MFKVFREKRKRQMDVLVAGRAALRDLRVTGLGEDGLLVLPVTLPSVALWDLGA